MRTKLAPWVAAAALTGALVGAGECALRQLAPLHLAGIQSTYEYDDELGYRLKPGIHEYRLTDNLQEIRTGPLGNVGFEDDFSGFPHLAFALGDSYTQGTGNSSDTSYPFQLDLLLNQDQGGTYSERVGVVNLGLAAFGTEQSLLAAKRYGELLGPPAYVLYLGCDNDWEDDLLFRNGHRHRHLVAGSPHWGRLVGPLLWLSGFEIVKRAKLAVAELRLARLNAAAAGHEGPAALAGPPVAERVWPVVSKIVDLARGWDATVVVSWANPYSDSYPWLKAKAEAEGVLFADWVPAMESVQERMPGLPYANSHSAGHWRPRTNQVIARTYARAMGVWPAPSVR